MERLSSTFSRAPKVFPLYANQSIASREPRVTYSILWTLNVVGIVLSIALPVAIR